MFTPLLRTFLSADPMRHPDPRSLPGHTPSLDPPLPQTEMGTPHPSTPRGHSVL